MVILLRQRLPGSFQPEIEPGPVLPPYRLLRRGRKVGSIGGGRTATYKNGIVSRLDNPLNLDVVERKLSEAQRKVNRLRLTWIERNTSKALEIAHGLLGARASNIDVALNDLRGAALSCIGDCSGCDHRLALLIAHQ